MTNKQLAEALKMLGFIPKDGEVDLKGGQTTTWAAKLHGTYGVDAQKFAQAQQLVGLIDKWKLGEDFYDEFAKTTNSQLSPTQLFEKLAADRIASGSQATGGTGARAGSPAATLLGNTWSPRNRDAFLAEWRDFQSKAPKIEPAPIKGLDTRDIIQSPQRLDPRTGLPGYREAPAPPPANKPAAGPGAGPGPGAGTPGAGAGGALGAAAERIDPAAVRDDIYARYGWAAGLLDIPEIASIMNDVAAGRIDAVAAGRKLLSTNYYKTTTQAERNWKARQTTDPADSARDRQLQYENLRALTVKAGLDPAQVRLDELTDLSLRFGWSQAEVNRYLASEARYDPGQIKSGTLKELKDEARLWLVPLSDQTMTQWAQAVVGGTKTVEDFREYARGQAKSMFPALGAALDDPNMNTRAYLDPYGQTIAKTLGTRSEDIDWTDPKYLRFINQIDPKTNQRTVMSLADTQRTLMADAQYGFDKTENGRAQKNGLARQLLDKFGFGAGGGQ